MASRGPVSRGPPASSPPFWWPLHFGMTEVYVPSDRRSALVECLAKWCRAECVTSVGGGRPVRPGAMLVRQGWQGLNASSTSAQTSKAYSYDWLKATAQRHIGRGGPSPAGDRDADSCSGVRSNTYAVLLDCVEMLTSMHALDPDIASEVNAALTYLPHLLQVSMHAPQRSLSHPCSIHAVLVANIETAKRPVSWQNGQSITIFKPNKTDGRTDGRTLCD